MASSTQGLQTKVHFQRGGFDGATPGVIPPLLGAQTVAATGGDGLWIGYGGTPHVALVDPLGDTIRTVVWSATPVAIGDAEINADIERRAQASPMPGMAREMFRQFPYADRLPHFDRMLSDDRGQLWIRKAPLPGGAGGNMHTWMIFGTDGALVAQADTPVQYAVLAIAGDRVLARVRNDSGEEGVGAWPLMPRRDE
jgi:hypothetical protein